MKLLDFGIELESAVRRELPADRGATLPIVDGVPDVSTGVGMPSEDEVDCRVKSVGLMEGFD